MQKIPEKILSWKFEYDTEAKTMQAVSANETYTVPIGALVVFRMVITVDDQPAEVIESNWQVIGTQIVGGSVIQTLQTGAAETQINPNIPGGYGGDPSLMGTAWVDEGPMNITITGTFVFQGLSYPFEANGQAIVVAPGFSTEDSVVETADQVQLDKDVLSMQMATPDPHVTYSCSPELEGGEIGFLQTVYGYRYRGVQRGVATQRGGFDHNFIDAVDADDLFYHKEIAGADGTLNTQDNPGVELVHEGGFVWYRMGMMPGTENYTLLLAYKAPENEAVVESYIVIKNYNQWYWAGEAYYDDEVPDDPWTADAEKTDYSYRTAWTPNIWTMPLWENNSEQAKEWHNI